MYHISSVMVAETVVFFDLIYHIASIMVIGINWCDCKSKATTGAPNQSYTMISITDVNKKGRLLQQGFFSNNHL